MCPLRWLSPLAHTLSFLDGTRTISGDQGGGSIVQQGSKLILDPEDRLGRGERGLALIKSIRAAVSIKLRILELRNYDGS